jgi:hypothetical protein
MSRLFQPIPAKPAFGILRANNYASDYIQNKKSLNSYRDNIRSPICKKGYSEGDLLRFNKGYYLYNRYLRRGEKPFNKYDLIAGNYAKQNLNSIVTVSPSYELKSPYTTTTINPNVSFYTNYNIDPEGALFGNSECGLNNWTNFMKYKSIVK